MAVNPIRAVLFDMGGTLENLYYDAAIQHAATCGLRELLAERGLDPGSDLDLMATVLSGMKAYQSWRQESEIELPPERVWTEYILTDHGLSRERLIAAAEDITYFYETHYQVRSLRPEAPVALDALHKKGLRLAVISNIISRRLVPCKLAEYGITHYFGPVVTSSSFGWRKPNVRIFTEAARLMRLPPAACAYVGDTISRDVIGARRAGYGLVIQIKSFLTDQADCELGVGPPHDQDFVPDAVVKDLTQIVDLVGTGRERPDGH
jgi:putative hydrolase of the HAD superfamily